MSKLPSHNFGRECETRIGELRLKKGITMRHLAAAAKTSVQQIYAITWGRISPTYIQGPQKGELKPVAKRVCRALNADPSEAFPLSFCGVDFRPDDNKTLAEISLSDWCCLSGRDPAEIIECRDYANNICSVIKPKELDYIKGLAYHDTLEDIGLSYGVSRERVRQVVKIARRRAINQKDVIKQQEEYSLGS